MTSGIALKTVWCLSKIDKEKKVHLAKCFTCDEKWWWRIVNLFACCGCEGKCASVICKKHLSSAIKAYYRFYWSYLPRVFSWWVLTRWRCLMANNWAGASIWLAFFRREKLDEEKITLDTSGFKFHNWNCTIMCNFVSRAGIDVDFHLNGRCKTPFGARFSCTYLSAVSWCVVSLKFNQHSIGHCPWSKKRCNT